MDIGYDVDLTISNQISANQYRRPIPEVGGVWVRGVISRRGYDSEFCLVSNICGLIIQDLSAWVPRAAVVCIMGHGIFIR